MTGACGAPRAIRPPVDQIDPSRSRRSDDLTRFLATDGITNVLDLAALTRITAQYVDPECAVTELLDAALERGTRDDATCIATYFQPTMNDRQSYRHRR